MRVLVKDQQDDYGDLEIFDTLFKVKTQKNPEVVLEPKRKWFNLVVFVTVIYLLVKFTFV